MSRVGRGLPCLLKVHVDTPQSTLVASQPTIDLLLKERRVNVGARCMASIGVLLIRKEGVRVPSPPVTRQGVQLCSLYLL